MAENVFILGAGFSAPTGAPVVYNFLKSAENLLTERRKDLEESGYLQYFQDVFDYRYKLRTVNATFSEDLDDIEKLYSYLDFECRYVDHSNANLQIRKSLIFMIVKTIDMLATRETLINVPASTSFAAKYDETYGRQPPNQTIYAVFAMLLSGLYKSKACNSSVITFNYDVILDNACHNIGIMPNYCLEKQKVTGVDLKILKLHGSANWMTCAHPGCDSEESLVGIKSGGKFIQEYQYEKCPNCGASQLMPLIVPPSWDKTQFSKVLAPIWEQAGNELRQARNIFIIGYSLPEADQYFKYLLYTNLSFNKNTPKIYIINSRSASVAASVIDKFKKVFNPKFYERNFSEKYADMGTEAFIDNPLRSALIGIFEPHAADE